MEQQVSPVPSSGSPPYTDASITRPANQLTCIFLGGYKFTRANKSGVKTSYRCSKYRSSECKAKAEYRPDEGLYIVTMPHSCRLLIAEENAVKNIEEAMKDRIDELSLTEMTLTARAIWRVVNSEFYLERPVDEAVVGLDETQVMNRVANTRRQYWGGNVHGIVERPPLSLVKGSALRFFQFHFVYYEEGQKDINQPQRLIGWAHPSLVKLLMYNATNIFVDGTFRCVPIKFRQCIVIMVLDQATGIHVPVFYVLSTSKSYVSYANLFTFVVNHTNRKLRPATVVCDFEAALINAVASQFPEFRRIGCFFHFKQAVSRKMEKLRLPKLEIDVAMEKGMLDMLTVIKRKHIAKKGVALVQQMIRLKCAEGGISYSESKWISFWNYFHKTWIDKYTPDVWNVHGRTKGLVNRTNNPLERFNRELNKAITVPHPTMPVFVNVIEQISREYVQRVSDTPTRAKRQRRLDVQLPPAVEFESSSDESDQSGRDNDLEPMLGEANYSDDSETESEVNGHLFLNNDLCDESSRNSRDNERVRVCTGRAGRGRGGGGRGRGGGGRGRGGGGVARGRGAFSRGRDNGSRRGTGRADDAHNSHRNVVTRAQAATSRAYSNLPDYAEGDEDCNAFEHLGQYSATDVEFEAVV